MCAARHSFADVQAQPRIFISVEKYFPDRERRKTRVRKIPDNSGVPCNSRRFRVDCNNEICKSTKRSEFNSKSCYVTLYFYTSNDRACMYADTNVFLIFISAFFPRQRTREDRKVLNYLIAVENRKIFAVDVDSRNATERNYRRLLRLLRSK